MKAIHDLCILFYNMPALHLVLLPILATFIGLSEGQCYGRVTVTPPPPQPPVAPVAPCCQCSDDVNLSTLLYLAKANEKPAEDINLGEIINKLINALIYATTNSCSNSAGGTSSGCNTGTGGTGCGCTGTCTCGNSGYVPQYPQNPQPQPKPTGTQNPALIDLGLLSGNDLLDLLVAGHKVLNLDLGGKGGGAVTNLVNSLL